MLGRERYNSAENETPAQVVWESRERRKKDDSSKDTGEDK